MLASGDSRPVTVFPPVRPAFLHVVRTVCAHTWGRAIRARSLNGFSCQAIRDRCTVSLAYDRRFYMRNVRYVPMCAGVRFVQDRSTGAHVRWFGTSVQYPLRVPGVAVYAPSDMCWCVRACNAVHDRLMGALVRVFGDGVQYPSRVAVVCACAACGICETKVGYSITEQAPM